MGICLCLLDLGAPPSKGINFLGEVAPPSERSLQFSTFPHVPCSLTMKTLWGCELAEVGAGEFQESKRTPRQEEGRKGETVCIRVFLKSSRGLGGPQAKHALLTVTLNGNWPQVLSHDFGSHCSWYRTIIIMTAVTFIELSLCARPCAK